MTEEEAKKKWCLLPNSTQCTASTCMAWRVAEIGRVRPGNEHKTYTKEGFCGLAGVPQ